MVSLWCFARARTGYIEGANRLRFDERPHNGCCLWKWRSRTVDYRMRLLLFDAAVDRRACAALRLAEGDDQRALGLGDVARRSLGVAAAAELTQRVTVGNAPIFCQPSCRTPAAAFRASSERGVERAAVDAGLAARDDLQASAVC